MRSLKTPEELLGRRVVGQRNGAAHELGLSGADVLWTPASSSTLSAIGTLIVDQAGPESNDLPLAAGPVPPGGPSVAPTSAPNLRPRAVSPERLSVGATL